MTRPVTLAYGLSDSPVGLLAWLVEKFRAWSDSHGDLSTRFSDDDMLTWTSLYWLTNTIATSFRPYNDGYARAVPTPTVTVPTGLAVFPAADLVTPAASLGRAQLQPRPLHADAARRALRRVRGARPARRRHPRAVHTAPAD